MSEGQQKSCTATVEGEPCRKPVLARDLCVGHHRRDRKGQDMDAPWRGSVQMVCTSTIEGQAGDSPDRRGFSRFLGSRLLGADR